ncbi:RNA polymerase sigma factor [Carboxylicivirga sediminis]|uniref:RNA polymerase sigma factor n=1 Tax=Carboxylicivirga sediminis TaxID=2006564 RepID=A0A941F6X2_9BACT|nr:RNA polymerase sigma factor [Carboxylicivirga sediminis]MBR8537609.1 RNA polymerase sigma factor [Carboxylicivirga sediminis]
MKKEELFNTIVDANQNRIRRICAYYNENENDQQDMFQEILINIWKSLDNFKNKSSINTWVYRVAVNTALSFNGKSYKYMRLIVTADMENLNVITDDSGKEKKLLEEQQLEQLQNELNILSVIDKALVSLMLEGLSMKEISDIIGITEANVKVKIHRIKDALKSKLNTKR